MTLLEISLSAVLLIILVMIIRALGVYHISKRVFVFLWSLILLRLLTPFTMPKALDFPQQLNTLTKTNETPNITIIIQKGGQEIVNRTSVSVNNVMFMYLLGMIIIGIYLVVLYCRSYWMFSQARPVNNEYISKWKDTHRLKRKIEVKEVTGITSPLTYGIVKPVILLPQEFDWDNIHQVDYVFEHEFIHIKRFDVLRKVFIWIALAIHWFNPFVWILYIFSNRDIELACDEEVICMFGKSKKSEYATTLLNIEEKRSLKSLLHLSFSRNSIEERITLIMKAKKNSITIAVFSTVVLLGAFIYVSSPTATEVSKEIVANTKTENEKAETIRNKEVKYETVEMSYEEFMTYLSNINREYSSEKQRVMQEDIINFYKEMSPEMFREIEGDTITVTEKIDPVYGRTFEAVGDFAILDDTCEVIYATAEEIGLGAKKKCEYTNAVNDGD